jgi:starch phosphorylase
MIDTTEMEQRVAEKTFLPSSLLPLERLAWNYWWSWAPDGISVFRDLDPELWEECEHNPRLLFARTSAYRLAQAATDPVYLERVRALTKASRTISRLDQAGLETVPPTRSRRNILVFLRRIRGAQFVTVVLRRTRNTRWGPFEIGQRSAPAVGCRGLLYRYGYFRQRLNNVGWQEEHYGETKPTELPITLVTNPSGTRFQVEVLIRERRVLAQVWRANVGRVQPLYCWITNIPENVETDRWVTGHLYGGDRRNAHRARDVAGYWWDQAYANSASPHVYHLNEGHSAFLTLELTRELVQSRD